ncbi:hypothetical protein PENVUL_c008G09104 [Penicillium vulpinum]|uniref:Uncharacterized protein n=1 Tax=Penicillium vulpinum TaxID=29845 RepID=A0A1V6S5I7_9EURO|nr:hypothetical protein PENVUL_c008G09104 [Penicillium vulpinum]
MNENIADKGNQANKAIEDTAMTDEVKPTEDGAKGPVQQKKKKKHSQAYYARRRTQEYKDQRQERRRLREAGIEVAKRPYRRPGRRRANKAKKAAAEAAKKEAEEAPETPAAASTSPTSDTQPKDLETRIVSQTEDEDMEDADMENDNDDVEMDLGPAVIMNLVLREKTSC